MDRRRALAISAFAAMFVAAASAAFTLIERTGRAGARRAWLAAQAGKTRELGFDHAYALDDARVFALSEFMDQSDAEFAAALTLYQQYDGKERDRLARYTCSAIMDWARGPRLTAAKRDAAECTVCDLVTEYSRDESLVGPLFGAAMELQLGDNQYLRHLAHQYVDDPTSNRQVAEFVLKSFLNNPYARAGAVAPAKVPLKVATTR